MNASILSEINSGGIIAANPDKVDGRGSVTSAQNMTNIAIQGLGGPVFASMTDHTVVDSGLNQAKTLVAIQKGGEKSVSKAPVDRAIAESLTLNAISSGSAKERLSHVETAGGGLSAEQIALLQADAAAEKERAAAARKFGGGDTKTGMASILGEIQGQGGAIAVPSDKAKNDNAFLNQTKTLMEINSLGGPVFASMTDHKPQDSALVQAKTMIAIQKKGEAKPGAGPADRAISEALTMKALTSATATASLKHVDAPDTSLNAVKLADLQQQAQQERRDSEAQQARRSSIGGGLPDIPRGSQINE